VTDQKSSRSVKKKKKKKVNEEQRGGDPIYGQESGRSERVMRSRSATRKMEVVPAHTYLGTEIGEMDKRKSWHKIIMRTTKEARYKI
jgi:hypothetical protein